MSLFTQVVSAPPPPHSLEQERERLLQRLGDVDRQVLSPFRTAYRVMRTHPPLSGHDAGVIAPDGMLCSVLLSLPVVASVARRLLDGTTPRPAHRTLTGVSVTVQCARRLCMLVSPRRVFALRLTCST